MALRNVPFVSAFFLCLSGVHGLHWNIFQRLCPEELVRIPDLVREIPIPVGCEIVDCCPGCPGPGFLDWKILVDKNFRGGRLVFEGLSTQQLQALKLEGDAKLTQDGIQLGGGAVSIRGIPALSGGKPPVAFLNPAPPEQDKDAAGKPEAADRDGGFEILQFAGRFQVNQFRFRYAALPCLRPPVVQDRIRLNGNTGNDQAVVLMDTRQGGACVDDGIVRTAATAGLGNLQAVGTCNSEVSVFSDDNAMSFQTGVSTWTNNPGDLHTVNLAPILTVPVSVWVAGAGMLATAQNDVANANLLYNQNNVGVQFNATFNDVSGNAAAVAAIGTGCPAAAGPLQGSAWYTANTLNAYYVNSAFTGVNCGVDRNMNFIGTTANPGSLPHEFGHAYGLRPSGSWGHTNGVAGFGNNNLMWGGGPGTRNHFSVAQAFRINTDNTSMLNANGNRTGATRSCLPNVSSNICPALALDDLPH